MANTGLINAGELTPNMTGGTNGGQGRISDGNNATFTQRVSFSGATLTHYAHSFSGTDIPDGATIEGCELIVHARYEAAYTAINAYFGIAHDGDGTDGNASSATFSDVADGSTGYTGTVGIDNGGGDITGDGGIGVFDLTDSFSTKTFGSSTTTWNLDWPTTGIDLTNMVVKIVIGYDVSSGIYIFDFAELDLKIYYSEAAAPEVIRTITLKGGNTTLQGGSVTIK